ncbi:MAG TPA: hypothetical protein VIL84_13710 [Devosiaceae bacterium]
MRRRHLVDRLARFIAPAILVLLSLVSVAYADSGPKVYHNTQWVDLPDGTKALDVRWAVGNPIKVTTLRIPKAYLGPLQGEALCHPFSPKEVDPNCAHDFKITLLLRATLPDFRAPDFPLMEDRPDLADIELFSTALVPSKDPNQILREELNFRLERVRATSSRVRDLSPIFGLEGMGTAPTSDLVNMFPQLMPDIYYNAQSPEEATVFLACMDDDVSRIVSPYYLTGDKASCDEHFYLDKIRATASVEFSRKYMMYWKEIPAALAELTKTFLKGE